MSLNTHTLTELLLHSVSEYCSSKKRQRLAKDLIPLTPNRIWPLSPGAWPSSSATPSSCLTYTLAIVPLSFSHTHTQTHGFCAAIYVRTFHWLPFIVYTLTLTLNNSYLTPVGCIRTSLWSSWGPRVLTRSVFKKRSQIGNKKHTQTHTGCSPNKHTRTKI